MSNKLTTFIGLGVGLAVAFVLTIYGMRSVWIFLIFPAIGAAFGYAYSKKATNDKNDERLEEEKRQRAQRAEDARRISKTVSSTCDKNVSEYKEILAPEYKADAQMNEALKELANAAELLGKAKAMAKDTKTKGEARK